MGLGFRIWGLGVWGLACRVMGSGFGVKGLRLRASVSGFRVQGFGLVDLALKLYVGFRV